MANQSSQTIIHIHGPHQVFIQSPMQPYPPALPLRAQNAFQSIVPHIDIMRCEQQMHRIQALEHSIYSKRQSEEYAKRVDMNHAHNTFRTISKRIYHSEVSLKQMHEKIQMKLNEIKIRREGIEKEEALINTELSKAKKCDQEMKKSTRKARIKLMKTRNDLSSEEVKEGLAQIKETLDQAKRKLDAYYKEVFEPAQEKMRALKDQLQRDEQLVNQEWQEMQAKEVRMNAEIQQKKAELKVKADSEMANKHLRKSAVVNKTSIELHQLACEKSQISNMLHGYQQRIHQARMHQERMRQESIRAESMQKSESATKAKRDEEMSAQIQHDIECLLTESVDEAISFQSNDGQDRMASNQWRSEEGKEEPAVFNPELNDLCDRLVNNIFHRN